MSQLLTSLVPAYLAKSARGELSSDTFEASFHRPPKHTSKSIFRSDWTGLADTASDSVWTLCVCVRTRAHMHANMCACMHVNAYACVLLLILARRLLLLQPGRGWVGARGVPLSWNLYKRKMLHDVIFFYLYYIKSL